MLRYIGLSMLAVFLLQGCSSNEVDPGLKSPCVSAKTTQSEKSPSVPCGPRRPINNFVS